MKRLVGTTIWFGPRSYGYIGWGVFTNNEYEHRVYVHYKNIGKKGQRDSSFRELKKNDIVEFEISKGYFINGTQAVNVDIIKHGES